VAFPAKLVAASSLMTFWVPKDRIDPAIWISLYAISPIIFNMFNVRRYGEIEFWLTTLKVVTIIGLIFMGLLLAMGASNYTLLLGTDGEHNLIPCDNPSIDNCVQPPGFNCITLFTIILTSDWREDGWKEFLVSGGWGRLAGFWACCCQAAFAYLGTEIIGITADETECPRRTLPRAFRRVSKRIIIYYVGAIFVLGLNVSSNDPELAWYITNPKGSYQGPFVLMVKRANIPGLEHVLNAIAIVAALSVANANLYVTVNSSKAKLILRVVFFTPLRGKGMPQRYLKR
jgi:yeast amino acid transporter